MKRIEKGRDGVGGGEKEEEYVGVKLDREGIWVGKRSCCSTPVHSWTLGVVEGQEDGAIIKLVPLNPSISKPLSARQLAAILWNITTYGGARPSALRQQLDGNPFLGSIEFAGSPDQPASASSLKRHIAASIMQRHQTMERKSHARQPVSPASYGSSLEVAQYNAAFAPSSLLKLRGRIRESNYSLRTSTELLKVLNRICSLEEQNASNKSRVKVLKTELDRARAKIGELLQAHQEDRQEIDHLMKQITEDKLIRRGKEQDRLNAAVESLRDELADERKLRKQSENLHRKQAREVSELKTMYSTTLKELKKERKSCKLLEDLCDEFAMGVRDYEQELHALGMKSDREWISRADRDHLILHMSDSWLDQRMQMKRREAEQGYAEELPIVDKLSIEIEAFLRAKRGKRNLLTTIPKASCFRRSSLESIPLNETVSAPRYVDDEDNSPGSGSHCFELNKGNDNDLESQVIEAVEPRVDERFRSNDGRREGVSYERLRGRNRSNLQVKFEEQMARAMSENDKKTDSVNAEQEKTGEGIQVESEEGKGMIEDDGNHGFNANDRIDSSVRSPYLLPEGGNMHQNHDFGEASGSTLIWSQASPVRQWMAKLGSSSLDISDSSLKLPPGTKQNNTLKAKLLEARSKERRSRLKA
ncbi:hypothetical protein RJ641_001346 [Dillenia turbinata]|uniref:Uncharacterized protein n=1 Tax=Dillenia turbinata TaxID=194707 RepID=A0AAN8W818_9MAGN